MSDKVYCCDAELKSNYCPHCGNTLEFAKERGESPFPYQFSKWIHYEWWEDEEMLEMLEQLGIDESHQMADAIMRREFELTMEIEDLELPPLKNVFNYREIIEPKVKPVKFDGRPLVSPEFEIGDIVETQLGIYVIQKIMPKELEVNTIGGQQRKHIDKLAVTGHYKKLV